MNLCYLALGSNLKSPERQLRQAIAAIRVFPRTYLIKQASFYYSQAWGRKAQPNFVNTVVCINTALSPLDLLFYCQQLEKKQERVRQVRWGSRTLDIDILLYGTLKLHSKALILPHPRLHLRDFVFVPLLEIASKSIRTGVVIHGEKKCACNLPHA